jgi:hypothetical protein
MNELDFIDIGCGIGGSIDWAKYVFGGEKYLGIDNRYDECQLAEKNGYNVIFADITSDDCILPKCKYITMIHFLEHLKNEEEVFIVLNKALNSVSEFICIKGPSFESVEYLKKLGFKITWTDWIGHPTPVTKDMLFRLLKKCGVNESQIEFKLLMKIEDTSSNEIIPLSSPTDIIVYDNYLGEKELLKLDNVYREIYLIIKK